MDSPDGPNGDGGVDTKKTQKRLLFLIKQGIHGMELGRKEKEKLAATVRSQASGSFFYSNANDRRRPVFVILRRQVSQQRYRHQATASSTAKQKSQSLS